TPAAGGRPSGRRGCPPGAAPRGSGRRCATRAAWRSGEVDQDGHGPIIDESDVHVRSEDTALRATALAAALVERLGALRRGVGGYAERAVRVWYLPGDALGVVGWDAEQHEKSRADRGDAGPVHSDGGARDTLDEGSHAPHHALYPAADVPPHAPGRCVRGRP